MISERVTANNYTVQSVVAQDLSLIMRDKSNAQFFVTQTNHKRLNDLWLGH